LHPRRRSRLPLRLAPGWIHRHAPPSRRSAIRRKRWSGPPLRPLSPRAPRPPPRPAASHPCYGCSVRPRSSGQRSPNHQALRTQSGHRRCSVRQGGGHGAEQIESVAFYGSVRGALRSLVFGCQHLRRLPPILRLLLPHPDSVDAELLQIIRRVRSPVQAAEGETQPHVEGPLDDRCGLKPRRCGSRCRSRSQTASCRASSHRIRPQRCSALPVARCSNESVLSRPTVRQSAVEGRLSILQTSSSPMTGLGRAPRWRE
jgi:hypothetical protein